MVLARIKQPLKLKFSLLHAQTGLVNYVCQQVFFVNELPWQRSRQFPVLDVGDLGLQLATC